MVGMWRVWFLVGLGVLLVSSQASAVDIDWVPIGNPGNLADDTGFGSVSAAYRISRHEVTVSQYAEFLNAVAQSDPHGTFVPAMQEFQGITRNGSAGNYSYTVTPGRENRAMGHIQFGNALRFTNWMNNGQGSGDTESGAYTISGTNYSDGSISRSALATIFLPSEDEWYKAAYFDLGTASYFEYPTASNSPGACSGPSALPNRANCGGVVGIGKELTAVGSYPGSASPYGTFDQGGNAWEWNEAWLMGESSGLRGGGNGSNQATGPFGDMRASYGGGGSPSPSPGSLDVAYGFRLASVIPEPSTGLLLATGILGLAVRRRV